MSELRTNRIVPRDGLPAGSFGGGIVQVRYAQQDSRIQLTSEGDLISASITPTRSDSKIMVDMRVRARSAGTNTAYCGIVCITKSIGYRAFSTLLLLNADIPKPNPKINDNGAATNINERVCIDGFH